MAILVDEEKLRRLLTGSFRLYEQGLLPISLANEVDLIIEKCKRIDE